MSEDERDIDVESDDVPEVGGEAIALASGHGPDKRAHHNALERRRRDHIKDSFHDLRDCIPSLEGEKVSRAHILNKATEYIRHMQKGGNAREKHLNAKCRDFAREEVEIDDLKVKNEILDEQVQALEHAKALGSADTAEDILQGVAEKVQERQRLLHMQEQEQQQQQIKMRASGKPDKPGDVTRKDGNKIAESSGRTHAAKSTPSASTDTRGAKAPIVADTANQLLPSPLNLLASNINSLKSAQTLLTALQKNSNLSANVKSLAARVLASPLRPTQGMAAPPTMPRGIVTATTVPKGSPIPSNLTSVLQQQKQLQVKPTPPIASQLKPTTAAVTTVPTSVQNLTATVARSTSQNVTLSSLETDAHAQISPTLLSQATNQLLVANSLLQQTASPNGNTNDMLANPPQLSSELLAQVSSFLNLPTTAVSKTDTPLFNCDAAVSATTSSGSVATGTQEMASDRLGSSSGTYQVMPGDGESTLTTSQHLETVPSSSGTAGSGGTKRAATESETDALPKKPRVKQ